MAALAAGILIGVGIAGWRTPPKLSALEEPRRDPLEKNVASSDTTSSRSNVRLKQIAAAKFFDYATPQLQSKVPIGHEFALTEGTVELQFPAGATAIIEAPAVFQVVNDANLLLKTGDCSVHAPDGAQGFRVDTPSAKVVDLGTRFVVQVAQSGGTKVQVVEGEADVYSSTGKENLRERQSRWIDADNQKITADVPFAESDYKRSLPDRITDFAATKTADTEHEDTVDELVSVSVQRDGEQLKFSVDQLIGIDLIHFCGISNAFMVTPAVVEDNPFSTEQSGLRSRFIDRDRSLCSGLINPGGESTPLTSDPILQNSDSPAIIASPGLGIRFQKPVANLPGPDVVFFELQTIVNSEKGDAFHVSPLHFTEGLHSHTIHSYDIDLTSPQSRFVSPYRLYRAETFVDSLGEALHTVHRGGTVHGIRAKVTAVGIDLSDLGYPENATVEGLFFQDAADDGDYFDPVFIAGLPSSP